MAGDFDRATGGRGPPDDGPDGQSPRAASPGYDGASLSPPLTIPMRSTSDEDDKVGMEGPGDGDDSPPDWGGDDGDDDDGVLYALFFLVLFVFSGSLRRGEEGGEDVFF